MAAKVKAGQPVQAELFPVCSLCGGEHAIWRDDQVAPVEVQRMPDGRVLICLWDGKRSSVWIEMSQGGRRWLAQQLAMGLKPEVFEESGSGI